MKPASRTNVPPWVVALALLGATGFLLPLVGLLARTPWADLWGQLADPGVRDAMRLSLTSSGGALLLAAAFGLPIAAWLASGQSLLRTAVRVLVMLPIVLPPVVAGVALLTAFGRHGVLGSWFERLGWPALPFTTAATVVAAAYMGLPFFVLAVEAGLRAFDRRLLDVAATLGAGPARRFVTVTLPSIGPALRTGALLCWARALGEYCATQTFAGNLAGTTRTMPLACGVAMEVDPDRAVALSLVLAALSVGVLVVLRRGPEGGR